MNRFLLALFCALTFATVAQAQVVFGQLYPFGGHDQIKILSSRGSGATEEYEVQYFRDEVPGNVRWEDAESLRHNLSAALQRDAAKTRANQAAANTTPAANTAPTANNAPAGNGPFTFGQLYGFGGHDQIKLLGSRGSGATEEYEVQYFRDGVPGNVRWEDAASLRHNLSAALEREAAQARANGTAANTTPPVANAPTPHVPAAAPPRPVAQPASTLPKVANNAPLTGELSEAVVKEFVARQETRNATGVGSAPKTASVTFSSVRFGAKRAADKRDRLVNGITGPTVHPVRVNYTVLRTWGNGETENKTINYDYEFYKDEYGEWKAYLVGPAT